MKKILSLLASIGLTSTAASAVISCSRGEQVTRTSKPEEKPISKETQLEKLRNQLSAESVELTRLENLKKELSESNLSNAYKRKTIIEEIEQTEKDLIGIKNKIDETFAVAKSTQDDKTNKQNEISNLLSAIKQIEDTNSKLQKEIEENDKDLIFVKNLIPTEKEADQALIMLRDKYKDELNAKEEEWKEELQKLNDISEAGDSMSERIKGLDGKLESLRDIESRIELAKEDVRANDVQQGAIRKSIEDAKVDNAPEEVISYMESQLQKKIEARKPLEDKLTSYQKDSDLIDQYKSEYETLNQNLLANNDAKKQQRENLNQVQSKVDWLKDEIAKLEIEIKESYDNFFERNKKMMDYYENRQLEIKERVKPQRDQLAENKKQIILLNSNLSKSEDLIKQYDNQLKDYDFLITKLKNDWNRSLTNKEKLNKEKDDIYNLVEKQIKEISKIDNQIIASKAHLEIINNDIDRLRS